MKCEFFVAAVAALALASCSGELVDEPGMQGELVDVEIAVSCGLTKAVGVTDDSEKKVNSLQVFVFGEGDKLEAYKAESSSNSLKMGIFSGKKNIYALVNADSLKGVSDYDTFISQVSDLKGNRTDNFVMSGKTNFDVGTKDVVIPIEVRRLVSKVSLVKVENRLAPVYEGLGFKVVKAYLINVVGSMPCFPGGKISDESVVWYHKRGYSEKDGISALAYDDYSNTNVAAAAVHDFYCYPNPTAADNSGKDGWTARYTRLVVEIELGGKIYFYPIKLPNLEQNTAYDVTLAVTRPGSSDPDVPYDPDAATVNVTVAEWTVGNGIVEEI